jgi:cytochrome c556
MKFPGPFPDLSAILILVRNQTRAMGDLLIFALLFAMLTAAPMGARQQQNSPKDNMAGMDMSGDMKDMGPSMAAMAGHMYITPLRTKQPGDEEKVKALVAQVKASIERYRDYHKALEDGYVIGNPNLNQPQFHFTKEANVLEAEKHFDLTKPSSLLYFQTPTQRYKLEGVMFTVPPQASEDELNERIPPSVVRWH